MRQLILHVGAHRTATTYVQRALANNAPILAHHGISYKPITLPLASAIKRLRNAANANLAQSVAEDFLAEYTTDHETSIFSWEGLIGGPVADGKLYGHIDRFVPLLEAIKRSSTAQLILSLSIRRQDDFISSWYAQTIKEGSTDGHAAFVEKLSFKNLDWSRVTEPLSKIAPLRVVAFEEVRQGNLNFLTKLLPELPVAEMDIDFQSVNQSYSAAALDIALFANRNFVSRDPELDRAHRQGFRNLLASRIGGPRLQIFRPKQLVAMGPSHRRAGEILRLHGASENVTSYYDREANFP